MAIISCKNLSKAFPLGGRAPGQILKQHLFNVPSTYSDTFWALKDVSFEVEKGEALAIVGRNGSGKSTLLQVLTGVYPPTSGELSVSGKISALLELGSGFDPEYTGRQNIFVNGAILGLSETQIRARMEDIIAFADIGEFIDEPVRVYSSGMFVRLAFSVAVHVDPEILIVDEALSVGDARFAAKCMRRIRAMRDDGLTLLFVSHDVGSVRALCDRAIWLSDGVVRKTGPVFDVTAKYMEYLFADEPDDAAAPFDSTPEADAADGGVAPVASDDAAPVTPVEADEPEVEGIAESGVFNHWGSRVGCVAGFRMEGRNGLDHVFEYREPVRVVVDLDIPDDIDTGGLSLAFSIKDLRGTDLMVCASALESPGLFGAGRGRVKVAFEFENFLTEGKYYVALAVEDRSQPAIHYYEYIEGIDYFASMSSEARFGVFNVPVSVKLGEPNEW